MSLSQCLHPDTVQRADARFPVGKARLETIGVLGCACLMSGECSTGHENEELMQVNAESQCWGVPAWCQGSAELVMDVCGRVWGLFTSNLSGSVQKCTHRASPCLPK
eukprot:scaffold231309_cov19-Tisochrysis_lutea.AAC.1